MDMSFSTVRSQIVVDGVLWLPFLLKRLANNAKREQAKDAFVLQGTWMYVDKIHSLFFWIEAGEHFTFLVQKQLFLS